MDDNQPASAERAGSVPYLEPTTVAEMDERAIRHVACGPCPRCAGKDHCDSLIGGPGEGDYAPMPAD